MSVAETPRFRDRRESIGDRLAATPGLLLGLDFDGTLAPIVTDPDDAAMDEALRDRLSALAAAPTVEPAVVSGRRLADLRERVDVDGVTYAGNHGLELRIDGERRVPERAAHWRDAVAAVRRDLRPRLADVPGCEIEDKGLTATVHLRRVPEDRRDEVIRIVQDVVESAEAELSVSRGKAIREVRPPIDRDKGHAVERLAERVPDEWLPVYVGDDVTDEDAFEALDAMDGDGLALLVGDREDTTADFRLGSRTAVAEFLSLVATHHGEG